MTIPQSIRSILQNAPQANLRPLLEVELKGNLSFEHLLSAIYKEYGVLHKLLKVNIEYSGNRCFGKLLLHLQGTSEENTKVIDYFNQNRIQNTVLGYA